MKKVQTNTNKGLYPYQRVNGVAYIARIVFDINR